ncbi:Hcp family type VI secretion system effector [Marivita hallyeonensis]|uniref:Type VI secretion system secreted protein Hcp n=1 Tax=Marivita hallyeonensis TaxID=996342 RepID=A0A1M5PHG0_9RHOB|nr:type VI secretion system tube protein Hcp [Marivita hallyeonensis]SHH01151.1 type VI secretion system secreted protein Hcp [Marivita hallyeonensis]
MAVDMFIKIGPLDGESKDHKKKGEIDVLAWSWGCSNSGTWHHGGGGGAGKANYQDLSITTYIENSTSALLQACGTGEHFDDATLTVRKAGKKPLEYLVIKMKKILVTSVSFGGSGGEERLTQNVTLNFAEIEWTYKEQKDDGSGGPDKKFAFDIEANEDKS